MKISIPTDIQLRMEYRMIEHALGRETAAWVTLTIFTSLALSVGLCEVPGQLTPETEAWLRMELGPGFDAALASKLLIKHEEHLVCPLFVENNRLTIFNLSESPELSNNFTRFSDMLDRKCLDYIQKLPSTWWRMNGESVLPQDMQRAISLISTLDYTFYKKMRAVDALHIGTVHTAVSIVKRFQPEDLRLILRRLMQVSRPKLDPRIPSVTESALTGFDMICRLITPEEGFEKWYERAKQESARRVLEHQLSRAVRAA